MGEMFDWSLVLQFAFLLTLLGVSLGIKAKIKFFRKHLIPTALFGGFIGLLFGPELLNWVPFDQGTLLNMVYHFTAIGFIAMALKEKKTKTTENIINTGFAIVNTYIVQAALGIGIALLLMTTITPELPSTFGILLPLSFAQGPGQAEATGRTFEALQPAAKALADGANAGVAMATLGFLWAIIGGIPFMHIMRRIYGVKKEQITEITSDTAPDIQEHTAKVPRSIYLDDLTVQAVLIGICYLLTYLLLAGLQAMLGDSNLMRLFWGFQFLFGTLIALAVRALLNILRKRNIIRIDYADNYLLQRISSASFDLMIVASVCAISFKALAQYIIPMLIISTAGGLFTMIYSAKVAKWIYREERFEHAVGLYGMWTGTIVTSMALLKEIDPNGKSSVPESLVLGSGFGAIIGIPLMMVIAVPVSAWVTDNSWLYVLTYAIFAIYSAICIAGIVISKKLYAKRLAKKAGEL